MISRMAGNRRGSSGAVAAEAWRLLLGCTLAQLERVAGVVRGLGLSPGDVRALLVLDRDEPRAMGSLAQAWHCDASNVTWMVDRLQERGLVERRPQPTDRRVKAVVLTELGSKAKAELLGTLYEPPAGLLELDRPPWTPSATRWTGSPQGPARCCPAGSAGRRASCPSSSRTGPTVGAGQGRGRASRSGGLAGGAPDRLEAPGPVLEPVQRLGPLDLHVHAIADAVVLETVEL